MADWQDIKALELVKNRKSSYQVVQSPRRTSEMMSGRILNHKSSSPMERDNLAIKYQAVILKNNIGRAVWVDIKTI